MLARVAAVGQFPGFTRWVCAADHTHSESTEPKPGAYRVQFFTPAEYEIVDQSTERIIPRDDSPGARDAGVSEFIDFMVAHDDEIQYAFRTGLAWLDAFATEKYGRGFCALATGEQEALLSRLAYRNQQSPTEMQGQEFFKLLREYTVMGYYTSRMGLEQLDYPGLKIYSVSPECPHKEDPEHRRLPPPRL